MASSTHSLVASDVTCILELCSALYDKSASEIQIKINNYLRKQTGSSTVFLVPLLRETEEAVVQVIGENVLNQQMRFPLSDNVLNTAVKRRCSVEGTPSELDLELLKNLRATISPEPRTFLNVPVLHPEEHYTVLVVCLVDYDDKGMSETTCTQLVTELFRYCLGTVLNTFAYEEEKQMRLQCQSMLSVAKNIFSHLGDLADLLREIMVEARKLTNAERCSLFLLDSDHDHLVAKIFDGETSSETLKEMRIAKNQGIAGHVATTGEVLNIRNAYSHPLFYKGIDERTGFKTRNILCFPIRKDDEIIGVAQLCNKKNGLYFDVFDEEVAMAFSIYCGISIMHSLVYRKIQEAQARNQLINELMIYHMKVSDEDVEHLLNCPNNHDVPNLSDFGFSPRSLPWDEMACYTLLMFQDLQLDVLFNIKRETLARFILFVKKGYRDTPYHNWRHAFSTIHFAYLLIKNLDLINLGYITPLEALAFMVSCVCHDLDHRGTTNSFQTKSGTALADLYSSEGSVMERHHFAQAACMLNTPGCNILDGMPREDYTKCVDLIRDMILATDLATHFKTLKEQQKLLEGFEKDDENHRHLLLSLLMTACDLSDQTKDWSVARKTADLIYKEFFTQGDMEKTMGTSPIEAMDRDRAYIPTLQIQFLDSIVIPLYE
ncbi:cGMP-dependent 3',5'-cyclic phosphodiesterase-like isoform X2 [Periplaneta americana]